jgi:hypothetical protein
MMADAERAYDPAKVYYCTAHVFSNSTTSSPSLMVWRELSNHLALHGMPLTGEELAQRTGLSLEQIDALFDQVYYQRYYGFRRFMTLEEWRQWAEANGVIYVPEQHDPPAAEPAAAEGKQTAE